MVRLESDGSIGVSPLAVPSLSDGSRVISLRYRGEGIQHAWRMAAGRHRSPLALTITLVEFGVCRPRVPSMVHWLTTWLTACRHPYDERAGEGARSKWRTDGGPLALLKQLRSEEATARLA